METSSTVATSGLLDLLLGLIFVLILIFALAWAFKRFGAGRLALGGAIRVLAAMSLGGRDRIALISVGKQQLLIAVSPGRVNTLHVFEEPVELEADSSANLPLGGDSAFAAGLNKMLAVAKK